MEAGTGSEKPYGSNGNVLEIILYGADPSGGKPLTVPGRGVACHQPECGVPADVWANGAAQPVALPGFAAGQKDYFYPYHALPYDGAPLADGKPGYFGAKVLALSYGGKLLLRGYKGAQGAAAADADPKATGSSWVRLGGDLETGQSTLILDPPVTDWTAGDRIVVTGTDYLPNHSEEFTITKVAGATLTLDRPAGWHHNGAVFPLAARLQNASAGFKAANRGSPLLTSAETRAAVALMSRSIRIVSGGDSAGEVFDWESPAEKQAAVLAFGADSPRSRSATERDPSYQYGGHVIARQGFETLQVQGVEFRWLGQGGRMGHYPLHFHMARKVPDGTYVKDSAIHESMTRWIVLHATQGVTLQRNIGYRSIGHGFYLEDATETDNRLFANLGIFARGAVAGPDNPRNIPGILARTQDQSVGNTGSLAARARSDVIYPTAFWITNGWNDFVGNMAAGAGTCGACYWLVPAGPNGMMSPMKWSGYAGLQARPGYEGSSPLKQFYANHCSTAMHSFNAVGSSSPCAAVGSWSGGKMQNADPPRRGAQPGAGADIPGLRRSLLSRHGGPAQPDGLYPADGAGRRRRLPDRAEMRLCRSEDLRHHGAGQLHHRLQLAGDQPGGDLAARRLEPGGPAVHERRAERRGRADLQRRLYPRRRPAGLLDDDLAIGVRGREPARQRLRLRRRAEETRRQDRLHRAHGIGAEHLPGAGCRHRLSAVELGDQPQVQHL